MFKRGKFAVALAVVIILFQFVSLAQNSISGTVSYHNDPSQPMSGVEVTLYDLNGDPIETQFTNEGGKYLFEGLTEEEYLIEADYDQPLGFNIDLDDILLLLDYLFGNGTLDPIQLLAADVDGSGIVDYSDFEIIVYTYYLQQQSYPVGDWVFSSAIVSPNYKDGTIVGGTGSGDVNGGSRPDKNGSSEIELIHENNIVSVQPNEIFNYNASVTTKSLIGSFYFSMKYDNELVNINNISSSLDGFEYYIDDEEIRIIWVDEGLQGLDNLLLSDLFSINLEIIDPDNLADHEIFVMDKSSIVDIEGNLIYGSKISFPTLNILKNNSVEFNCFPNPCTNYVNLEYQLSSEGSVTLFITNMRGQIVEYIKENDIHNEGIFQSRFAKLDLEPGIYFYNFSFIGEDEVYKSGKIVFL